MHLDVLVEGRSKLIFQAVLNLEKLLVTLKLLLSVAIAQNSIETHFSCDFFIRSSSCADDTRSWKFSLRVVSNIVLRSLSS